MKTSDNTSDMKATLALGIAIASINNSGIVVKERVGAFPEQTFLCTEAQIGWRMISNGLLPWLVEGVSVVLYDGSLFIRQATPKGELGEVKISESVVTPIIIEAVLRSMLGLVF